MRRRRPGSVITFAVLNFVLGGLLVICGVVAIAKTDGDVTVNGVRTDLNDNLRYIVPGYAAYPVISLIGRLLLAVGFIVSGVGLLQTQNWGRILAIVSAGSAIVYILGEGVYEIGFVLPAIRDFMGPIPLVGGFATGALTAGVVVRVLIVVSYSIVLLVCMLQGSMARVFTAGHRGEPEPDDDDRPRRSQRDDDYDDDYDDRPRRRSRRDDDDDDDDYDRPRRRRRDDDY